MDLGFYFCFFFTKFWFHSFQIIISLSGWCWKRLSSPSHTQIHQVGNIKMPWLIPWMRWVPNHGLYSYVHYTTYKTSESGLKLKKTHSVRVVEVKLKNLWMQSHLPLGQSRKPALLSIFPSEKHDFRLSRTRFDLLHEVLDYLKANICSFLVHSGQYDSRYYLGIFVCSRTRAKVWTC